MSGHMALKFALAIGDLAVKSVLILLVAWLATVVLRKAAAATRHLVWLVAFCALLILPILTLVGPARNVAVLTEPTVAAIRAPQPTEVTLSDEDFETLAALDEFTQKADNLASIDVPTPSTSRLAPIPAQKTIDWTAVTLAALAVWLAGVLGVACQSLWGLRSVWFLKTRKSKPVRREILSTDLVRLSRLAGVRRRWELRLSDGSQPPAAMTWGFINPVVLLPHNSASWTQERLEAVLLHELAHVRRFDSVSQLIAVTVSALYWFNPAVWLCARAMRAEAETAADDTVLRMGVKPSEYARELLRIAADLGNRRQPFATIGVPVMKQSKIELRVKAILDPAARRRRGVTVIEALVTAGIAAGLVLPLGYLRASVASAQPRESAASVPVLPSLDLATLQVPPQVTVSSHKASKPAKSIAHKVAARPNSPRAVEASFNFQDLFEEMPITIERVEAPAGFQDGQAEKERKIAEQRAARDKARAERDRARSEKEQTEAGERAKEAANAGIKSAEAELTAKTENDYAIHLSEVLSNAFQGNAQVGQQGQLEELIKMINDLGGKEGKVSDEEKRKIIASIKSIMRNSGRVREQMAGAKADTIRAQRNRTLIERQKAAQDNRQLSEQINAKVRKALEEARAQRGNAERVPPANRLMDEKVRKLLEEARAKRSQDERVLQEQRQKDNADIRKLVEEARAKRNQDERGLIERRDADNAAIRKLLEEAARAQGQRGVRQRNQVDSGAMRKLIEDARANRGQGGRVLLRGRTADSGAVRKLIEEARAKKLKQSNDEDGGLEQKLIVADPNIREQIKKALEAHGKSVDEGKSDSDKMAMEYREQVTRKMAANARMQGRIRSQDRMQAKADVAMAKAQLEQASKSMTRINRLYDSGTVSSSQLAAAKAALKQAQAQLKMVEAILQKISSK